MKKTHLIGVIGMLAALITCPVQAGSISGAKQDELKSSDVKGEEEQSNKSSSSTLIVNNDEANIVDCFYLENAIEPFCQK